MAFLKSEPETFKSNEESEMETLQHEKFEEYPRLRDGESKEKYETSRHGKQYDEISRVNSIVLRLSFFKWPFANPSFLGTNGIIDDGKN